MLLYILLNIILPVFLMIAVGFLFDRAFKPDINTLSKLNFYVFVPALTFVKIIDTTLATGVILRIAGFVLAWTAILFLIGWIASSFRKAKPFRPLIVSNAIFNNCGNYGFPLVLFAFGGEYISVLAVFLVIQNILTFTVGLRLFNDSSRPAELLRIPVFYAVLLGWLIHGTGIRLPENIMMPLNYLANSLIPLGLLTLGVQLSRSLKFSFPFPIGLMAVIRLLVGPLVALPLVRLLGFDPAMQSVLIVTAGLPAAVNVYILAEEYGQKPDIASQTILWTTLVSALTLSGLLILTRRFL